MVDPRKSPTFSVVEEGVECAAAWGAVEDLETAVVSEVGLEDLEGAEASEVGSTIAAASEVAVEIDPQGSNKAPVLVGQAALRLWVTGTDQVDRDRMDLQAVQVDILCNRVGLEEVEVLRALDLRVVLGLEGAV